MQQREVGQGRFDKDHANHAEKKEMREEQESGLAFEEPGNTTLTAQYPYFISVSPNLFTKRISMYNTVPMV